MMKQAVYPESDIQQSDFSIVSSDQNVCDLERGIAVFSHNFEDCHTEIEVVRHYAPWKI